MNIYRIMLGNAFVLIVLGVWGYFTSGSPTALIAPAIGLVLSALAFPTKNGNKAAAHIAIILTLIAAVTFFIIGIKRGNTTVIVMAVFSLLAFFMYLMDFMRRMQEREKAKE